MKKELLETKKVKIKRIGNSPYFSENFLNLEKIRLEQIKGVEVLPFNTDDVSDIIISNTHSVFDEASLHKYVNTSLFIHSNSGYDNFKYEFVKNSPAPIIICNEIRKDAVANFIISAIFKHITDIPNQKSWDVHRRWKREILADKKILIIGFGNIGKILYQTFMPLVKDVTIYDPFLNYKKLNLENVDIIIPVCGLNPSSNHLLNKHFFDQLKSEVLIINAARGELINTVDLIDFLARNENAYAYLDVFEQEPNNFELFKSLKNINLSSHIAGVFSTIEEKTIQCESLIIEDFLSLSPEEFKLKYSTNLLQNKMTDHYLI